MDLDTQRKQNLFSVRVSTMEADLEFKLEEKALGRDLFDLVCRALGLREIWFFGLQFTSNSGYYLWMQMNKKVLKQNIKHTGESLQFMFLVKFFPEAVEDELIQDVTRHLFYLQVKQSIINMDVYCPPEASVLLATYAVQAELGDFDADTYEQGVLQLDQLLPQRVLSQYQMTPEMWEDRIRVWWMNNRGLSREDAELEYLKIAQDLNMFGVHYFPISNKKNTDLLLGVTPLSVSIYEQSNRLLPKTCFKWNEIGKIAFKDKKFTIKCLDGTETVFCSQKMAVNQVILDLCIGSHNLFLRRRQPDSLEIQQMKMQSKAERQRRQASLVLLEKERNEREKLEREKEQLKHEVSTLLAKMNLAEDAIRRTSEMNDLLAEKARISEEEALVLSKRASEAEAEIQRIRISAIKTEETKIELERKAREAEIIAKRMLEESDKWGQEADQLKNDLNRARHAEQMAKQRLHQVSGIGSAEYNTTPMYAMPSYEPPPPNHYQYASQGGYGARQSGLAPMAIPSSSSMVSTAMYQFPSSSYGPPPPDPVISSSVSNISNIHSLSAEMEKERVEYMAKSRNLQEQLSELRNEIESLKVEERQTGEDRIYADTLQNGETKYSTLRKSGAGSTKKRIQLFDGL